MKKLILFTMVFVFMFAGMSSAAAIKLGVIGGFGNNSWYQHPALVITPGNISDVNYDIVVGYYSIGVGEDIDANVGMLLGGTWWVGQKGPITYGPSLVYYTQSTAHSASPLIDGDKASDNYITSLNFICSGKTTLIPSVDLRADVVVYSSVSGQDTGDAIKEHNRMLDSIQLSLQYNFTI